MPFSSVTNIDVNIFPEELIGRTKLVKQIGEFLYGNSGVMGSDTSMERLQSYPGFQGAVIRAIFNKGPSTNGMQRPYVAVERVPQKDGPLGYEASYLVEKAPITLANSNWDGAPIALLASIQTHTPRAMYRPFGGVRLWYGGEGKYYVSAYVTTDFGSSPSTREIGRSTLPFEIGVKQGLRFDLLYKDGIPLMRVFLIKFLPNDQRKYFLIGETNQFPEDHKVVKGEIVWVGGYGSNYTYDYIVVNGEAKLLR